MSIAKEEALTPWTPKLIGRLRERTSLIRVIQEGDCIEADAAKLRQLIKQCIAALEEKGLVHGDTVAIFAETSLKLLGIIFAAWELGAKVCVLPSAQANVSTLALPEALLPSVKVLYLSNSQKQSTKHSIPIVTDHEIEAVRTGVQLTDKCEWRPKDVAVVQMSSGSSGIPKLIPLSWANIDLHYAALSERVDATSSDHMVSWLPLYHDMGLGAVLTAIWANAELTLLPTVLFSRAPISWFRTISERGATLTAAPAFAYSLTVRLARRLAIGTTDLSKLRYAWIGAEPVFSRVVNSFRESMSRFGLRANVLSPAYGLAEAVLAIAMRAPNDPIEILTVDATAWRRAGVIVECQEGPEAIQFVSNGRPINSVKVQIQDEYHREVGAGKQGRLCIRGDSVFAGYLSSETHFDDKGWFDTGDLGFIKDEQIYISGRQKDVLIRGGANFLAGEIELEIEAALNLRSGQSVAFSWIDFRSQREEIVALIGKTTEDPVDAARRVGAAVAAHIGLQIDRIEFVSHEKLLKTTSGKLRRSAIRDAFIQNKLGEFKHDY